MKQKPAASADPLGRPVVLMRRSPPYQIARRAIFASLAAGALLCGGGVVNAGPANQPKAEVVILGAAGGPQVRLKRHQSTTAIVIDGSVYIVDLGDGAIRQLAAAGLKQDQVRAVFLTLFSQDRVSGLTPYLSTRWLLGAKTPLAIYAPVGLKQSLEGVDLSLKAVAASSFVMNPNPLVGISTHELVETGPVYEDQNVRVTSLALPRSKDRPPVAFAYRFETPAGSIVFTGATGAREALVDFAKGADIMVSEVVSIDGIVATMSSPQTAAQTRDRVMQHMRANHLDPEQIGQLAAAAKVGRVVLHHLEPGSDSEDARTADRMYAEGVRKTYRGPVTVGHDLQQITLEPSKAAP